MVMLRPSDVSRISGVFILASRSYVIYGFDFKPKLLIILFLITTKRFLMRTFKRCTINSATVF